MKEGIGLKIYLNDLIKVIGGKLIKEEKAEEQNLLIDKISIDSRTITPGALFWAIEGERFDGHDFVADAIKNGAMGAVTSHDIGELEYDGLLIKTGDTLSALQDLAKYNRKKSNCKVVAVTGSSGKTFTKELIAHLLKIKYNVLASHGNFNNHIGVPLTLLEINPCNEFAVVEMGMNAKGEIAKLTDIVQPDIGVITNIGKAHIGLLGSYDSIIKAKAELLLGMNDNSLAIINFDNAYIDQLKSSYKGLLKTVGSSAAANIRARDIKLYPNEQSMSFIIDGEYNEHKIMVPVLGEKLVINVLIAILVAIECGIKMGDIKYAMSRFKAPSGRMSIERINDFYMVDDTYNANPESMMSSIGTMSRCKLNGRAIIVVGDMMELGDMSSDLHAKLGEWIHKYTTIDYLLTYGEYAKMIAKGAKDAGFCQDRLFCFDDIEGIVNFLINILKSGDWVLIKGSRGMKMESIIQGLKDSLKVVMNKGKL